MQPVRHYPVVPYMQITRCTYARTRHHGLHGVPRRFQPRFPLSKLLGMASASTPSNPNHHACGTVRVSASCGGCVYMCCYVSEPSTALTSFVVLPGTVYKRRTVTRRGGEGRREDLHLLCVGCIDKTSSAWAQSARIAAARLPARIKYRRRVWCAPVYYIFYRHTRMTTHCMSARIHCTLHVLMSTC